jgi:hypothetical protein
MDRHRHDVNGVAWSRDGRIASASSDGVRGNEIYVLGNGGRQSVAWLKVRPSIFEISPDGRTLAVVVGTYLSLFTLDGRSTA